MKIPAIKKLVEHYSVKELEKAEYDITEGNTLDIEVEGADEGEQLTHVLAAIWIHQQIEGQKVGFTEALREYTKKVRESIN